MAGADRPRAAGFYSRLRFWAAAWTRYHRRLSTRAAWKPPSATTSRTQSSTVTSWQEPSVADITPTTTRNRVLRGAPRRPSEAFVLFTEHPLALPPPGTPPKAIPGSVSSASSADSLLLREPEPGKTRVVRRMRMRCGHGLPHARSADRPHLGNEITARNFLRGGSSPGRTNPVTSSNPMLAFSNDRPHRQPLAPVPAPTYFEGIAGRDRRRRWCRCGAVTSGAARGSVASNVTHS